jgi:NaMN:DMB phosphoribosyltransferase
MNEDGTIIGGTTAGSGAIAGLGINPPGEQKGISPQGEPGVKKTQQNNYKKTNIKRKNPRPFRDILSDVFGNRRI